MIHLLYSMFNEMVKLIPLGSLVSILGRGGQIISLAMSSFPMFFPQCFVFPETTLDNNITHYELMYVGWDTPLLKNTLETSIYI